MKLPISVLMLLCLMSLTVQANIYHYDDYKKLRSDFDIYSSEINNSIEAANKAYINSLNSYQHCSSNAWRATFTSIIPEIDARRFALDDYKKDAYTRAGKQNYELYKIAKENNINKVKPEDDISEFMIWYKNHVSFMKAGPFHELEVYIQGYEKLSNIYGKMATACHENRPSEAADFDLVASGIKGLLDDVLSLIGRE